MSLTSTAPHRFIRTRPILISFSVACVGVVGLAAGLTRHAPAGGPTAYLAAARDGSPRPRVEPLRVTLRPTGFDPSTLTASHGHVLLAVDDLSGLDDVELRLEREAGGRLREVKAGRGAAKWRDVFKLTPGDYVLSVGGRPGWDCRITVTAD